MIDSRFKICPLCQSPFVMCALTYRRCAVRGIKMPVECTSAGLGGALTAVCGEPGPAVRIFSRNTENRRLRRGTGGEARSGQRIDVWPAAAASSGYQSSARQAARLCVNCGVVEAINLVEVKGTGSYLGMIAGGVAGALLGSQVGQGRGTTAAQVAGAAGGAFAGSDVSIICQQSGSDRSGHRTRARGGWRQIGRQRDERQEIVRRAAPNDTPGDPAAAPGRISCSRALRRGVRPGPRP